MHIILTLDDNQGMMFNHRRQSRDRVMLAHMLSMVGDAPLRMTAYTAKLFTENLPPHALVVSSEALLRDAATGVYCFVEDGALAPCLDRLETLYVYRWNRVYPADQHLDIDLSSRRMTVIAEFSGSSHDKITLERYD